MIARAILAPPLLLAVGTALDRVLGLAPADRLLRIPLRLLAAIVFAYLALALPWLLAALVALAWWTRPRTAVEPAPPRAPLVSPPAAIVVVLGIWIVSRPATPMLWDEFVWLAKARMEASAPGMLVPEVLRPASSAIPAGYPVLAPLACAMLAGYVTDTTALARAANELTCLALLTCAFAFHASRRRPSTWAKAAVALAAPLVLVHLRTAYVDITVGLLAAALALLLEAGMVRAACVVALALGGLKDEGTLHVLAIACVFAALTTSNAPRGWRGRAAIAIPGALAAAAAAMWRLRLALGGVEGDHGLGVPQWGRVRLVFVELVRDVSDPWSWGCFWPVALATVFTLLRAQPGSERERVLARAFVLQVGALVAGVLLGPDRVIEFVVGGTLIDRMLVQLAPMAMLLVLAIAPAARADAPPTSTV